MRGCLGIALKFLGYSGIIEKFNEILKIEIYSKI